MDSLFGVCSKELSLQKRVEKATFAASNPIMSLSTTPFQQMTGHRKGWSSVREGTGKGRYEMVGSRGDSVAVSP